MVISYGISSEEFFPSSLPHGITTITNESELGESPLGMPLLFIFVMKSLLLSIELPLDFPL